MFRFQHYQCNNGLYYLKLMMVRKSAVLASAINSLRYQKKNKLSSVYVKIEQKVDEVTKNISSLSSSDKEFDIKLLSEQVSNEAIKEKEGEVFIFYL